MNDDIERRRDEAIAQVKRAVEIVRHLWVYSPTFLVGYGDEDLLSAEDDSNCAPVTENREGE